MKVFVVIEMEVSDSSAQLTESQARQIAFDEISSKVLTQKKTGRPASGPKASVSGITVEARHPMSPVVFSAENLRNVTGVLSTVEFDEHTQGRD